MKLSYKEDEGSLFARRHMERTMGDGHKLHLNRFQLAEGNYCTYSKKTVIHLDSLPRDVAESPSL